MAKRKEIKIACNGTEFIDLKNLCEFQEDIKTIKKENLQRLKDSIIVSFRAPIFVWKNKTKYWILDGHQRRKALIQLEKEGWKIPKIPIVEIFAKTKTEAKGIVLDYVSQHGEIDKKKVKLYVHKYKIDLKNIVIRNQEISINLKKETKGDDEYIESVDPITKKGDLWEIGRHRILCADGQNPENYQKLLKGELCDMYLTDPPYNVDYTGKTKNKLKIKNDKMTDEEFRNFLKIVFKNAFDSIHAGACFYIWFSDSEVANFSGSVVDCGQKTSQCLLWIKNSMVMGRKDYQLKHELCLYGWKLGSSHYWGSDRKQTTDLYFDRPSRSSDHPNMKPVELFEYLINNSSKENNIILDNFLGSGTSVIASEKTNRICYGMDIDPKYCDVSVSRYINWCKENNIKATIKHNGKEVKSDVFQVK